MINSGHMSLGWGTTHPRRNHFARNSKMVAQIEEQGWSLNPGRYVGVAEGEAEDFDFTERLEELNEELETLNGEAHELEERIAANVGLLIEGAIP